MERSASAWRLDARSARRPFLLCCHPMKKPEATAPTPKPRTAAPNSDRRGLTNARAAAATSSGMDVVGSPDDPVADADADAEMEGSGEAGGSPGSALRSSGSTVRSMRRNAPSAPRSMYSAAASRGSMTTPFSPGTGTDAVDAGAAAALARRGDAADDATHDARARPRAKPRAGSVAGGTSSSDALARGRAEDAAGTGRLGATDGGGRRRRARARARRGDATLARTETLTAEGMTTARVAGRARGVVPRAAPHSSRSRITFGSSTNQQRRRRAESAAAPTPAARSAHAGVSAFSEGQNIRPAAGQTSKSNPPVRFAFSVTVCSVWSTRTLTLASNASHKRGPRNRTPPTHGASWADQHGSRTVLRQFKFSSFPLRVRAKGASGSVFARIEPRATHPTRRPSANRKRNKGTTDPNPLSFTGAPSVPATRATPRRDLWTRVPAPRGRAS